MTGPLPGYIFFSDLDGTLLDHENYDWSAAKPALSELKRQGLPLILASSKTAAEVAPLRRDLGFEDCPAIVENGAGLLPAKLDRPDVERSYDALITALHDLPPALGRTFLGFSGWSAGEIARRTGLDPEDARRAKERDFSEPGIWTGDPETLAAFVAELGHRGITAQQGGRFLTLSFGADKAGRMDEIITGYASDHATIVALGDSPNDAAMLIRADIGVVIPNPSRETPLKITPRGGGRSMVAAAPGPVGWNRAVLEILGCRPGPA